MRTLDWIETDQDTLAAPPREANIIGVPPHPVLDKETECSGGGGETTTMPVLNLKPH